MYIQKLSILFMQKQHYKGPSTDHEIWKLILYQLWTQKSGVSFPSEIPLVWTLYKQQQDEEVKSETAVHPETLIYYKYFDPSSENL